MVIEIDSTWLDQRLLYPDEDFVAQLVAQQINTSIAAIHDDIRENLTDMTFQDPSGNVVPAWEVRLATLATCCYRGVIPRAAMTRYCVFDWRMRNPAWSDGLQRRTATGKAVRTVPSVDFVDVRKAQEIAKGHPCQLHRCHQRRQVPTGRCPPAPPGFRKGREGSYRRHGRQLVRCAFKRYSVEVHSDDIMRILTCRYRVVEHGRRKTDER